MDARHDFDFLHGRWTVHNHKLVDVADPVCEEWADFEATGEVTPLLRGLGHLDRMQVPGPTDGGEPFEGMTLRLCDPATGTWTIWWSSSRAPGRLDPPMVGRFADGTGTFEGQERLAGRDVRLRFEWTTDPDRPRWVQLFSWDDGATWSTTWTMELTRR